MSMNLLRLFSSRNAAAPVNRAATAPVARERLQILLAHERGLLGQPDLLVTLREEILAVVSRHIQLDPDKVTVKLERGKTVSTLEVDIEVPNEFEKSTVAAGRRLETV
jgi:cell division topological specificity factor